MCASANQSRFYTLKTDPHSSHSVILHFLAREEKKGRVLDVGSGSGFLAQRLVEMGFVVVCTDKDQRALEAAQEKGCKIVLADLDRDQPYFEEKFDYIIYADVLEHLRDPQGAYSYLNTFLQDEGVVVVSLPNVANIIIRLMLLFGRFEYMHRGILDRTHLRFFTLRTALRMLKSQDLTLQHIFPTPLPLSLVVPERHQGRLFSIAYSLLWAAARMWQTLFAYQFVFVLVRRSQGLQNERL